MYELIEFCSNPDCDYKATYKEVEEPAKFCTKCGSPMIIKCPKCGEKFSKNTEKFCSNCGASIKEAK